MNQSASNAFSSSYQEEVGAFLEQLSALIPIMQAKRDRNSSILKLDEAVSDISPANIHPIEIA